ARQPAGRRRSAVIVTLCVLLSACATQPTSQPLTAPDWPAVPPGVLDSLCGRLQMDAIATGAPLTLVSTTRPLATPQSVNALALMAKGRVKADRAALSVAELNRALPITTEGTTCRWRPIKAVQAEALHDEMIVELSAPSLHPFAPKTGGLFARVTVGGQGASWYWITLFPTNGRWVVGPVYVLVQ
ncbi:MAG TPA: hypothetical protein VFP80_19090, partial [Thermoanaerobaculia bacterium]|nr:hypothetical protein [Thermoanaerobaculia bacterium]